MTDREPAATPDAARCDVAVGVHPAPYWIDRAKGLRVCDRHRSQYEERADEFGPFEWEPAS